jgi:hypothetical protein
LRDGHLLDDTNRQEVRAADAAPVSVEALAAALLNLSAADRAKLVAALLTGQSEGKAADR